MQGRPARIERHLSGLGHWEMVRAHPGRSLRAQVRGYCGYVEQTKDPMRRCEVPSGDVVLVFNLGEPLRLIEPRDGDGAGENVASFVAGLYDSYSLTETVGAQCGVQVDFTPLGAHMFFGIPMDELANRAVRLEDVLGPEADRVTASLGEATNWEARFDLLDAVIADRLSKARSPSAEVTWAWRRLKATQGRIPVSALASDLGWSRRHLAARFRRQVGLTPKVVATIFRFRRAIDLLERPDRPSLAEIANVSGYYDQAHLNRDFRRLAGRTPSEFIASRLPNGGGLASD